MAGNQAKTGHAAREAPKKHHCPQHGKVCSIVVEVKGWKTRYDCPSGCRLGRSQVELR